LTKYQKVQRGLRVHREYRENQGLRVQKAHRGLRVHRVHKEKWVPLENKVHRVQWGMMAHKAKWVQRGPRVQKVHKGLRVHKVHRGLKARRENRESKDHLEKYQVKQMLLEEGNPTGTCNLTWDSGPVSHFRGSIRAGTERLEGTCHSSERFAGWPSTLPQEDGHSVMASYCLSPEMKPCFHFWARHMEAMV